MSASDPDHVTSAWHPNHLFTELLPERHRSPLSRSFFREFREWTKGLHATSSAALKDKMHEQTPPALTPSI